jgi:hypothetical protein
MKEKKIDKIKKPIVTVLKKHGVKKAGIFGSYARGEENKSSDIDILIEPAQGMSLLDIVILEKLLKKLVKKKIDLLTYNGISPYLKECILNEEVRII